MNAEVWHWGPKECRKRSLGENLRQGFFAGVIAETIDENLGAATNAGCFTDRLHINRKSCGNLLQANAVVEDMDGSNPA